MENELTVIILSFNEEVNISYAIRSVKGWAKEVIVLDSHSTDRTVDLAREMQSIVYFNTFLNYSEQRNYALSTISISTEWVMFLDADEYVTEELKREIGQTIKARPEENGYYMKFRFYWMGKWIKRGYYPTWILRLFRNGKARSDARAVGEHLLVEGKIGYLQNDIIHEDRKGIGTWIDKHNRYADHEAQELFRKSHEHVLKPKLFGEQREQKKWIRYYIWNKLPPVIRPFLLFFYRYILCGGFLDGRAAFIYYFFHELWFQMLIDAKALEKHSENERGKS